MEQKEKRLAIVVQTDKCFDCKACMIACKVENQVPDGYWRNWVKHNGGAEGLRTQFQPGQCMQCSQPSCVAACPVNATYRLPNGVVAIDPKKCIGCGNCVTACPYGARFRDPKTRVADKCDFCLHRLVRGEQPACVETCPTKARVFGDLNDPESAVSKLAAGQKLVTVNSPQVHTEPNIYYTKGTLLLDWAVTPTLPGGMHMPPDFWRTS
ncbi:MAG: 4Fe-4S dicluster domain-containing protein [Desulfarculaceae bacterium]|nr:4Fe-4S dicluster domain-containing protein [Desulfarculaceae bacterium]MCF8072839.1 4Fe-4S dicluster domain-containing protein [Desulfarculaceae bacterium]MCF8101007.1 4Fe-4S dicluster domain-containing protein [Desulfarculaceae bacterium]MCF8115606.1 4Fe-4S dicluster domain-containing protein [Desulfarculaceae bacterium]